MTAGSIADARAGGEMDAQGRKGVQEMLREVCSNVGCPAIEAPHESVQHWPAGCTGSGWCAKQMMILRQARDCRDKPEKIIGRFSAGYMTVLRQTGDL